jgi:anti-sigma B factor antagonist
MTISVRESGAASVVDLAGDVDLGTSSELRRALFDLLGEAQKVAVNLNALRYIDSSGIATLIEVLKSAQRLHKQFVLFGLSPAVEDVFRLTHVNRVFQVFQTEEEAVTPA